MLGDHNYSSKVELRSKRYNIFEKIAHKVAVFINYKKTLFQVLYKL